MSQKDINFAIKYEVYETGKWKKQTATSKKFTRKVIPFFGGKNVVSSKIVK